MEFFSDAQGQLTPQSVFIFGLNLNTVETLWLSSLPERVKKIRSKMKTLEWPQGHMSRTNNSVVNVRIWQKFELIQAFMHVLITC